MKFTTALFAVLFAMITMASAQVPQGFTYQSVLRDAAGIPVANDAAVTVVFTVLDGVTPVYSESHASSTNQFGLINETVGQGSVISGNFGSIDWSTGNYTLNVDITFTASGGGTVNSTNQLLTVPFAMVAQSTLQPGTPGPTGPQGPAGADGADGADGLQGPTGPQGADGAQGPAGPQGPAGAQGPTGPQGPAGADGADGAQGPAGPAGPAGPQGPAGADGADGAQGPIGPQGPAGADGADGAQGPTGPQGPAGADGADGAQGPAGPAGPQGPAGADGADGAQGPQGPTGPQGPAGSDATADNLGNHSATQDLVLNDWPLLIRGAGDFNHQLKFFGGTFDGPLLQGFNAVVLKTVSNGDNNGIFIHPNGRVGIGTANPTNGKLHVEGALSGGYGNFTYYAFQSNAGSGSCCAGTVNDVSIHASNRVMASEFDAFSDARIKNVVGLSDNSEDLQTLLQLRVTDYRMKDKAQDFRPYKKVIAQQVEEVYPSAVSRITHVVPDIYTVSTIENGYVALDAEVAVGDKVKLIFEESSEVANVVAVDAEGFKVDLQVTDDVFVYGRMVDDFRTVDYEALSMLNLSATQELYRLITDQQDVIEALMEDKAAQAKSFSALMEQVDRNNELIQELKGILGISSTSVPQE